MITSKYHFSEKCKELNISTREIYFKMFLRKKQQKYLEYVLILFKDLGN